MKMPATLLIFVIIEANLNRLGRLIRAVADKIVSLFVKRRPDFKAIMGFIPSKMVKPLNPLEKTAVN